MPAIATTAATEAAMNDLDTILAELDADEAVESTETLEALEDLPIEEIVEEADAVAAMDDDDLVDLELAVTRAEAYSEQASVPIASEEEQEAIKAKAPKKRAAGTGAAKSSTPRVPRDISTVADEFFVLSGDAAALDDAAKAAAKVETMALMPSQKKVAEKFENLFTSLSVGKAPSTYVMIAFKLLDEKKEVTSADIVGAYKASGLKEGTARSQSGQIMNLFSTVKIADRAGQKLTLRADSTIAERLRSL